MLAVAHAIDGTTLQDHNYATKPEEEFLKDMSVINASANTLCEIEARTRGQASSKQWKLERRFRLQASNFGRICRTTDAVKLSGELISGREFTNQSIRHGRQYEATARGKYEEITGRKVQQVGIIIHPVHNFIACSPDGVVESDGIIEIKCPYTAKNHLVSTQSVPYLHTVDGELTLSTKHPYYYQVMGQLLVTGRQWCDFVIWTFIDCKIVRLVRDEEFIRLLLHKLLYFFDIAFRPALLQRFLYKDTHLLHTAWYNDQYECDPVPQIDLYAELDNAMFDDLYGF